MKDDLSGQLHALMERGLRPVTMTEIRSRVPVRMTALQRARTRLLPGSRRLVPDAGGIGASGFSPGGLAGRGRRTVVAAVAGAVGVAAIATGASIASSISLGPAASGNGAVELLAKVADAAARQPEPHVRPGQYMYMKTVAALPSPPRRYDRVIHAFPTIRQIERSLRHLKLYKERNWYPVGRPCRPGPPGPSARCPGIGGLNDPTYWLLKTLPTNPRKLLKLIYRVERGHGPGPAQEAFVTIGDLLRSVIAPPKVAAALYRAAALIPGVTLDLHVKDAAGRPGVAVGRVGPGIDGGIRDELIFSRSTSKFIGERTVIVRTGLTTSAWAILAEAFVDHRGQLP
jgi:hypothetical protein